MTALYFVAPIENGPIDSESGNHQAHKKHTTNAICPKAGDSCPFHDSTCPCAKEHDKRHECNRDHRDHCPTCRTVPKQEKKRRLHNILTEAYQRAREESMVNN